MAETWDWRQTYAQYGEAVQDQEQGQPGAPALGGQPPAYPQGGQPPAYPQGGQPPAYPQGPDGQYAVPQPYGPPQGYPLPGYGPYAGPYPQYAGYPPPVAQNRGRGFSVAAFILGGLALIFFPIVLGPLGIIFGFVGYSKGDRIGRWAGLMSIVTTIAGMAIGVLALSFVRTRLGG